MQAYPGMTYTRTERTAERIEHHYNAYEKPEGCPHCGCADLSPSGYRTPSCRHDVEDGIPVYLVIRKAQFTCADCSKRFPAASPVPMANIRTTQHFWRMVVDSGLSIAQCAREFVVDASAVKNLRSLSGTQKPRKKMKPRTKTVKVRPKNAPVFVLPPQLPWAANKAAPVTLRGLAA